MTRRVKVRSTLKQLDKFAAKILREFPLINSGGCCVFASLVGKHLAGRMPVRVRVKNWLFTKKSLTTVRKKVGSNTIPDWNKHGVKFGHVLLELKIGKKWYLYDATGTTEYKKYMSGVKRDHLGIMCLGSLSVEDAEELANCAGWNPIFNRNSIPRLEQLTNLFFKRTFKV